MHLLRKLCLAMILLSLTYTTVSAVTLKDDKDTILALGMEMANMRNMLEEYIMIGAKIKYKNPTQKLKDGILHYEKLLTSIENKYKTDTYMMQSIKSSRKSWPYIKEAMNNALNNASLEEMKKGAIFIHGNIRTVIKELSNMKKYILNKSDIPNKEALNAAIEIAASSRRLSAHYMMDLWHLDDPTIQKHWNKGLKIYADSIQILKASPYMYDAKFKSLLSKCTVLHRYFTKMGKKRKVYSILIDKKADVAFVKASEMTKIILK